MNTVRAQSEMSGATAETQTSRVVARESLDEAWWTGPIFASSAATLPQGHVLIEPYVFDEISHTRFDNNWSRINASHADGYRTLAYFLYGVSDTFMAGVKPQFGYNAINHVQQSGLEVGDTTVRLQYRFANFHEGGSIPTLSFLVDETFPTGKYDALGSHPDSALGAGAYVTTLSLYSQYYFWLWSDRILRARLDLSYSFADQPVKVRDVSVYGTDRGFRGHAQPGNGFQADLAFEYSLSQHWVPAVDIVYQYSGGVVVRGEVGGPAERSPGSESFIVAPAMEYNWSGHVGVIAGLAVTVAGRKAAAIMFPVLAINMVF